jgi:hypothetical protein
MTGCRINERYEIAAGSATFGREEQALGSVRAATEAPAYSSIHILLEYHIWCSGHRSRGSSYPQRRELVRYALVDKA